MIRNLSGIFAIWAFFLAAAIAGVLDFAPSAWAQDPIAPDMIRTIELTWEEVPEAKGYEIEIATEPEFTNPLYAQKVFATNFNADLLAGAYFYRVRALDQRGRPGRWTPIAELNVNPRPPILMWPNNQDVIRGNLPDTGLPLRWRSSGPGVRYVIEIRSADENGEFVNTVARQEVSGTTFAFFPQDIGKFQWEVHTLGPAGDEPGMVWNFDVEGVVPPDAPAGQAAKRIVRYIAPWYRNHWWLYARYGQSQMSYECVDQELGGRSLILGALTGYIDTQLTWQWHDPVAWTKGGYPWWSFDFELQRQTVLSESTILHSKALRFGAWYEKWVTNWRFSPEIEFGNRILGIYQARTETDASRSNSTRYRTGIGFTAEYKLKPFFNLGGTARVTYQTGGEGGLATINGDSLNLDRKQGTLHPSVNSEIGIYGTLLLSPRLKVESRLRYIHDSTAWDPRFFAPRKPGAGPAEGPSTLMFQNVSFDVGVALKF